MDSGNGSILLFKCNQKKHGGMNSIGLITDQNITDYVHACIASGKVVPGIFIFQYLGYGHAVLRNTDPRFTH